MSAAALLAAAAVAMPAGAPAGAAVDMPGRYFAPGDVQVLVGETVTWRNSDHTSHSVVAEDHSFHSEDLSSGGSYAITFDEPGAYAYYCSIHRSMRGTVRVAALGLTGPSTPLRSGGTATLDALVPAGTRSVELERLTAGGAETVAEAQPDAGGRATFHVLAHEPGRYRARAGALSSAVVPLRVAPVITATATRSGRRVTVRATIAPAQPGATVALKRYVRERFDYLPVRTTRTADGGSVSFTLHTARRVALRVGLERTVGGWAPADSSLLVVPRLPR